MRSCEWVDIERERENKLKRLEEGEKGGVKEEEESCETIGRKKEG